MGYYTCYTMNARTIDGYNLTEEMEAAICKRLREISGDAIFEGKTFEDCLSDELKWYKHEHDLLELSKEFPNVIFALEGEGEERDDTWRLYVHNGEYERGYAQIVWKKPENKNFRGLL